MKYIIHFPIHRLERKLRFAVAACSMLDYYHREKNIELLFIRIILREINNKFIFEDNRDKNITSNSFWKYILNACHHYKN